MPKSQRRAFKIAGAGCVVYRRRGKLVEVLLARRADTQWMLPRGKLQASERPRTAASREVLEETGVLVKPGIEVGAYSYPIGRCRYKYVQFFAATVVEGSPRPDNKEFTEVAWVDASNLESISPRDRFLVETVSAMVADRVL